MPQKKLYGAAAKARAKVLRRNAASKRMKAWWRANPSGKAKRKVAKRRKNPVVSSRSGGMTLSEKEFELRRKAALKKRRAAAKKAAGGYKTVTSIRPAKRKPAKKKAVARKPAKRKTAKRKPAKRKTVSRKKTSAAKTARRRKTTKKGKSTMTKKARRLAALRGWRNRRKGGKTKAIKRYRKVKAKSASRWRRPKARKYKRPLAKSRVRRSLRKARRTILHTKAYGSKRSRAYMTKHRMRSNPKGAVMDAIKRAVPLAISLYGARALSKKVLPKIPGLSSLGVHAAPAGAGIMLVAGAFITNKIKSPKVRKYREDILLALGLNFVDTALMTYMPASLKSQLGIGQYAEMGEYIQTGEYVDTGEYIETGDYIDVGMEEELGMEADMGGYEEAMGGIGTGIGTSNPNMLKAIPSRSMVGPIPHRSMVREVPGVGPEFDNMPSLYKGIFSGGF